MAFNLWRSRGGRLPAALAHGLTLGFVALCWLFFRADSLAQALDLLQTLLGLGGPATQEGPGGHGLLALAGFSAAFFLLSRRALALEARAVAWLQRECRLPVCFRSLNVLK